MAKSGTDYVQSDILQHVVRNTAERPGAKSGLVMDRLVPVAVLPAPVDRFC